MDRDLDSIRLQATAFRTLAKRQRRWAAVYARLARHEQRSVRRAVHEGTAMHALGTARQYECRADALEAWARLYRNEGSYGRESTARPAPRTRRHEAVEMTVHS